MQVSSTGLYPSLSLSIMDSFDQSDEPAPLNPASLPDPIRGRVVLVMTVELGEGQSDTLTVHEHDEPQDLAREFGRKHALQQRICAALTKTIERNLEELVSELESQMSEGSNIGEVLYQKGQKMKESMKERVLQQQQRRDLEEQKELTFHPVIIAKGRPHHSNPENDLLARSKQAKETMELKKQELLQQQTAQCTFVPKINEVSKRLASSKSTSQKCEELYREAKERKVRKEVNTEET